MPLPFLLGPGGAALGGAVSGTVQAFTERALDRVVDVGVNQLVTRVLDTEPPLPRGVEGLVPSVIEPESAGDEIIEELQILATLLGPDPDECPRCGEYMEWCYCYEDRG